jgi:predicted RNA-binding protein with PIN domain
VRTQRSPVEVLAQLRAPQWDRLARAVRRAVEQLPAAQVPVGLRPFRHWHPEALRDASRARDAVAHALAADARFRAEVADAVADTDQRDLALARDPLTLRAEVGVDQAVALLAVTEQWEALARLAAVLADERSAHEHAASNPATAPPPDGVVDELQDRVRVLARRLQQAERREADVRRRLQRVVAERDEARAAATRARNEHQALVEHHDRERADHRERLARLRRRVGLAERRAAASDARRAEVVAELAALSDRLQAPLTMRERVTPTADRAAADAEPGPEPETGAAVVPSRVRPAIAGRPSRLPTGVDPDSVTAAVALLQIPGSRVLVDGYNVTRDDRAVPAAGLEQQRAWLVRLMGGVVARFDVRPTLIFDGQPDVEGVVPKARGVIVRFTADETADELLVALLDQLPADEPVLVVTSDREIRAAAAVRDANSVSAGVFLDAIAM